MNRRHARSILWAGIFDMHRKWCKLLEPVIHAIHKRIDLPAK